jgi:hypothetical protein
MRTRTEILRDIKKMQTRSNLLKAKIEEIRGRMHGDRDLVLEKKAETKTDELNETQLSLSNLQRELELRKTKGVRHLRKKIAVKKKNSKR